MKKTLTALTALSFTLQANDNINQQIDSAKNKTIYGTPNFSVSKTVSLGDDVDNSGNITVGDILTYQISTTNNTNFGASGSFLVDTISDINASLVVGSVTTTKGGVSSGNNTGNSTVIVAFGTLNANSVADVQFSVLVNDNNLPFGFTISNQAQFTSNSSGSAISDDPSQPGASDPTLVKVIVPPAQVPINSTFGLLAIILSILASVKLFFSKKIVSKQ